MTISWIQAVILGIFACLASRCGNAGCIYRVSNTRWNCIRRCTCRILYRYSFSNARIKFLWIRPCIYKRCCNGNFFRCNGRNSWYSIILRNSNNQPCMAAYRMESCRKRRIQEIISCRYGITLDFSFNL